MDKNLKILITGGAGFIGASLIRYLNQLGYNNIYILEAKDWHNKWINLVNLNYILIDTFDIASFGLNDYCITPDIIIHLGFNSFTNQEANFENWHNNYVYTEELIKYAKRKNIYLINASSASVYGNNNHNDEYSPLQPQSFYAFQKARIDKLIEENKMCSLRFFNVYGDLESHKGGMASPVYRWLSANYNNPDTDKQIIYSDGIGRDFIYVNDVCRLIVELMLNDINGIFNCGTGIQTSWEEVFKMCYSAKYRNPAYPYQTFVMKVPLPQPMKKNYQYSTKADLTKFRNYFPKFEFTKLEDGIKYVLRDLINNKKI